MKFTALGGAESVGASCYYLKCGNANIIFDCGIGFNNGYIYAPDCYMLTRSNIISDFGEITHIFISHGHLDHIGHIAKLYALCTNAKIYSTFLTKIFITHQLYNTKQEELRPQNLYEEMAISNLLDNIITVGYNEKIYNPEYGFEFKFFDAGHIPGASMIYIKNKSEGSFLYTGDFSYKRTGLVNGYCIPSDLSVDTMLVCGLHSTEKYRNYVGNFAEELESIMKTLQTGRQINLYTHQLTKGIEILKILLIYRKESQLDFRIAISEDIYRLAEEVEESGYKLIEDGVFILGQGLHYDISVTDSRSYNSKAIDFSIHADFDEIVSLIQNINPKKAFIVHVGSGMQPNTNPIGQELFSRGFFTEVTYAKENEIYII